MKTQLFLVAFVRDCGIKESVILSELCRRAYFNRNPDHSFSVADCIRLFDYITERQIRTALNNLLGLGRICRSGFRNIPARTIRFAVSGSAYRSYFDAVIGNELCAGAYP